MTDHRGVYQHGSLTSKLPALLWCLVQSFRCVSDEKSTFAFFFVLRSVQNYGSAACEFTWRNDFEIKETSLNTFKVYC